jgi:hypothetical protein
MHLRLCHLLLLLLLLSSSFLGCLSYKPPLRLPPQRRRPVPRLSPRRRGLATLGAAEEGGNDKQAEGGTKPFADDEEQDNDDMLNGVLRGVTGGIESAVRATGLGDENYKFGDLSRGLAKDLSDATESIVKELDFDADGDGKVTLEELEAGLGDITQKAADSLAGAAEGVVRSVTGNEQYQFGDITKGFLNESDKALNKLRDEAVGELLGELTGPQQRALVVTVIQIAAECVLAFNFCANCFLGASVVAAWAYASVAAAKAAKAAEAVTQTAQVAAEATTRWGCFLDAHRTLHLFTAPAALPLAAAATLLIVMPYRRYVESIHRRLRRRNNNPRQAASSSAQPLQLQPSGAAAGTSASSVSLAPSSVVAGLSLPLPPQPQSALVTRALSLAAAWVLANGAAVAAATGVAAWVAAAVARFVFVR